MLLRFCFLFFFIFHPTILFADLEGNYSEVRIHNSAIEERLENWVDRTIDHALDLETSTHHVIRTWRGQLASLDMNNELEGLRSLNRLINSDVRYVDDYTHFHLKDYWADPETVLREGGDCEDIALLKAASLHRLRWPADRMHLLVGFLLERGKPESHAVLLVETTDGEQFILRSITDQVLRPDSFSFRPVYGVDGHGTLVVKPPAKGKE